MTLPRGAVGWSLVCDCGISRSCSLDFFLICFIHIIRMCMWVRHYYFSTYEFCRSSASFVDLFVIYVSCLSCVLVCSL